MILSKKQQGLAAIAALEAKGNLTLLHQAINDGLDKGLTVAEIKEALSQLYAYTGFPRSLNALGTLKQVVDERQAAGRSTAMGHDDEVLPPHFDALKTGTQVQTQLSGKPFDYTFAPRTDYYLKAHLFGDIFAGTVLTKADREIVTISAIAQLEGCEPQLKAHCAGALNMGCTEAMVNEALQIARAATGGATWPVGQPNTGYAQYFIGNSYLAPMGSEKGSPVNVTFEPGCRNNWHIHHGSVQVLICVSGRGWYVEEGKEPQELKPGVVIAIPEGVKHWHGAAKDSWMQHLTYSITLKEGATNEWLEPVSEEEYSQLR